jgi:AcrR family transcriptional regulator
MVIHISQSKRRNRKQLIITAAVEILGEQGPEDLSMAAVAERVGVVPSAIYRHFENRQAMIAAAIDSIWAEFQQLMAQGEDTTSGPLEFLGWLYGNLLGVIPRLRVFPKLLFSPENTDGTFATLLRPRHDHFLALVEGKLHAARDAGLVRTAIPDADLALIYWGMLAHTFLRYTITAGALDAAAHLDHCWQGFSAILAADSVPTGGNDEQTD